jgi:hypothetical protein
MWVYVLCCYGKMIFKEKGILRRGLPANGSRRDLYILCSWNFFVPIDAVMIYSIANVEVDTIHQMVMLL